MSRKMYLIKVTSPSVSQKKFLALVKAAMIATRISDSTPFYSSQGVIVQGKSLATTLSKVIAQSKMRGKKITTTISEFASTAADYDSATRHFKHQSLPKTKCEILDSIHKYANRIAREFGTNSATKVVIGREAKVLSYSRPGYVKKTTGEYVSSSYRSRGWSSCEYRHARCVVQVDFAWAPDVPNIQALFELGQELYTNNPNAPLATLDKVVDWVVEYRNGYQRAIVEHASPEIPAIDFNFLAA